MAQSCCSVVSKFCTCLTCGRGKYTVRFVHTVLCIGIPLNLLYNNHSGKGPNPISSEANVHFTWLSSLNITVEFHFIMLLFIDIHRWFVTHQGSFVYGFFYVGILLASLIFYYSACLSDPGYIDEKTLTHLADDEVS